MPGIKNLENIFGDMSYNNSTSDDDLANVTAWLPNKTIYSIVNGKWKCTPSDRDSPTVSGLQAACLGSDWLSKLDNSKDAPIETNLPKLNDTKLLISRSLNIPLWQAEKILSQKEGKSPINAVEIPSVDGNGLLVDVNLSSRALYVHDLQILISSLPTYSAKKFVFAIKVNSEYVRLLSVVLDICNLNAGPMKANPVDVLLFKEFSEDDINNLQKKYGGLTRLKDIRGIDFSQKKMQIVAGDFSERSFGFANHFIVDSSADLHNAVIAITEKVWLSAIAGGNLYRSLLFVHQPDYKNLIGKLEEKLNSLRVSEKWEQHSDFIKITSKVDGIDLPGVKVIVGPIRSSKQKLPPNGDLRGPTIIFDIGTSSDLVASTFQNTGLGHLLVVLPYRSTTELLSLANNHGSHNDVFLFSNNIKDIKDICKSIKGQDIKVNTCSSKTTIGRPLRNVWGIFANVNSKENTAESLNKKNLEELIKKAESTKTDITTTRPVGKINTDSENFIFRTTKPVGLCGIVLVNPATLDENMIFKIFSAITAAGNAAVVVCVGSTVRPDFVQKCKSQFIQVEMQITAASVNEALKTLASSGKIQLAVVYHSNNESISVEHSASFSNFIVTVNGDINNNLLQSNKFVYM